MNVASVCRRPIAGYHDVGLWLEFSDDNLCVRVPCHARVCTGVPEKSSLDDPHGGKLFRIVEVDGDVVEFIAVTTKGDITVITSMTREGNTLVLSGLHIDGPGAGSLGLSELRGLVTELGRRH